MPHTLSVFSRGVFIGLWFYETAYYLVVDIANWPEQTAFWVGLAILLMGGILGIYLTRRSEAVAMILISVFIGVDLISAVLDLDPANSFTAVIMLSLGMLGLVVQYAQYLREVKAERTIPFAAPAPAAPAPEMFELHDN